MIILLISLVGAAAVLAVVIAAVTGMSKGWQHTPVRRLLRLAGILALVCAVLGVLQALVGGP